MEFKQSTLGAMQSDDNVTVTADVPETQVVETTQTEVVEEKKEGEGLDANATKVEVKDEVVETIEDEEEENTTSFSLNLDESKTDEGKEPETKTTPASTSWQDAIKGVDRKEIAKALGFNDFALELDEYLSKGGNAADYLNAKAVDYTKVPDYDLLKDDLKRNMFPSATDAQLDAYIQKKYSLGEFADEDDKVLGEMELQASAHKIRQQRIAEQQSLKIPEANSNPAIAEWEQQQKDAQAQAEEANKRYIQSVMDSEATKNLISSKRVTIDLGEGVKPFNVKLDNPQQLMKLFFEPEQWAKALNNDKGEPNVKLMQQVALKVLNPNYEKDIFNAGKQAGMRSVIEEGQNAKRPDGAPVVNMKQEGTQVVGTGTIGSHSR